MQTFADAEVALAESLPGYESRGPQQLLAQTIETVVSTPENFTGYRGSEVDYPDWVRPGLTHLLGQAGCGVGKSLAYLIPAILSGKRVVVSVTTKALQDQIVSTDLPFLTEHLGVPFTWALLKGRSNYLCLNRLGLVTEGDQLALRACWEASQDPKFDGLRESINHDIPDALWSQVASESEECSNPKCKTSECYAAAARAKADTVNLVIANHALLFTDLVQKSWNRDGMLGAYEMVILDEAHACFVKGTSIDGVAIEDVKEGDLVRAFDPDTGKVTQKRVVRTMSSPAGDTLIRVTSGQSNFVATTNHPVWTDRGWVAAGLLVVGDSLQSYETDTSHRDSVRMAFFGRVDRIEVLERGSDGEFERVCPDGLVYNLEVEDLHTYFANGVAVHNCEDVAGNTLGTTLSEGSFNSFTTQVYNWAAEYADDEGLGVVEPIAEVTTAAKALFSALKPGRMKDPQLEEILDEVGAMYDAISALDLAISRTKIDHSNDHEKAATKKWRVKRLAISLMDRMGEVIASPQDEVVRWVEEETRRGQSVKVIKIAPILVAPFLSKWLFSKVPCVLVSATLAVKGDMAYIAGRLGVDVAKYLSIDVGTPFDFTQQGRLYIPVLTPAGSAFPAPDRDNITAWEQTSLHEIHRLVTASKGRALVLFTSIKHMKQVYESIQRMGGDLSYRMQGERGVSNRSLVDWLKDHDTPGPGRVLFGTKSFFTGVDVQGDALSLLVITKMPFPRPTEPLFQARCEAIEMGGGNSFNDLTMPMMSLELQQGVGRLIRHRGDIGVAAILDPRLVNKGYGKRILRDLPPMPQTFKIEDVTEFFATHSEQPVMAENPAVPA